MKRRDLVRKLAVPALIIFVVSIIGLIVEQPIRKSNYKEHINKLNIHIGKLSQTYQDYLTTTAREINSIPVSPEIIGKIESKVHKENPAVKIYLWMSDVNGRFLFGAPSAVFSRLNQGYNKHEETIIKEGYYMDRSDFLIKLVDLHKEINFAEFNAPTMNNDKTYYWRVYDESRRYRQEWKSRRHYYPYERSRSFVLSAPVTNTDGVGIGNVYLKIDDSYNHELYYRKYQLKQNDVYNIFEPILTFFAIISGMFLWFLVPTWVYIDAKQRDVRNPGMWAFFTLISAIIFGLTIYLITRPTTLKTFHCPQCENELNGTKAYCPYCGYDLSSTFCPQCQYPIKQQWQFCPSCRAELKQETPQIVGKKQKGKKDKKTEEKKRDDEGEEDVVKK
jgi:hypothetical protein